MNKYAKEFCRRGMMFGGFGPIILGIIFYILSLTVESFSLTGSQVLLGIVSIYVLAFIQAGITVVEQIEHWSLLKSMLCHFGLLYVTYSLCYLANSWIPFEPLVLVIFTVIFTAAFFLIWGVVYLCVRAASRKLNEKIGK